MKIINPGDPAVTNWWHGKTISCPTCSWSVVLEKGDEDSVLVGCTGPTRFAMNCGHCAAHIEIRREPLHS